MPSWTNKLALALTVGLATAHQTYQDFLYHPEEKLIVDFNGTILEGPGRTLTYNQTRSEPAIGLVPGSPNLGTNTFVFIMVDPTTPSGSISILHALETNLHRDVELTTGEDQLYYKLHGDPQNAPLAPYMGPNPPPGSPDHKYVQLLFKQPEEDFSIPGKYAHFLPQIPTSRVGFPLEQFVNETGLGEPVAGLYFEEGPRQVKFRKF